MKRIITASFCFLALLAMTGAPLQGADLSVLEVSPSPTPAQVKAAKQAFDQGGIVVMKGGSASVFEALLNVAMPQADSRHRQPPPCVQAARQLPSGRIAKFSRVSQPFAAQDEAACEALFSAWVARQGSLAEVSIPYWTHVEDLTVSNAWHTRQNVEISLDLSAYRANTIDPSWDYYLVLYTIIMVPPTGSGISIPTYFQTNAQYQNGIQASVYAFGPQANSDTISIGQGISFDENASGVYTAPIDNQPASVCSQDPSCGQPGVIWGYLSLNPKLVAAVIYQVPSGTPHLTLSTAAQNGSIEPNFTTSVLVPISAPQVLQPEQTFAMEGAKSSFDVNVSPYLQTAVAGLPGWMLRGSVQFTDPNGNVSQTPPTGSSSFTVSFSVPASPSCLTDGTCANPGSFSLQTNPAYAAIQTKLPPVAATTIELVPHSPIAGVLIAGGQDWTGNVLKTADIWNSQTGTVTTLTSQMGEARYQHTATLVAPSSTCQAANTSCSTVGQVLIAGGFGANGQALSSTEFYNPTTSQFSPGPTMTSAHAGAVALQLQDGRILIIGGLNQPDSATSAVDIYDPMINRFSSTPLSLTTPRWNFAASLLQDGSVLVQGGSHGPTEYDGPSLYTAEKLDNCGSGFYPLTSKLVVGRQALAATLLKNGQVFSVGGYNGDVDGGNALSEIELFTPDSESFSQVTPLQKGVRWASVLLQEDGKVAVIGGYDTPNQLSVFDSMSLSFVGSSAMTEQRDFPTAVRLEGIGTTDKGKILVTGGVIPNTGHSNGELVELYDPTAQTWTSAGNLSASRRHNTMTLYGKYAGSLPATPGCH